MQLIDRIGRRMKLHDLHVLMAVVRAGSMNKAAVFLNTTQPAVSKSIAELERTMGVRLLDRNAQGVVPTAYGRALLDGGTAMFDELSQAVKNIEFLADPTTGEVRVGSTLFLAASFVSAVVVRLAHRYPRIVFHLVTALAETRHRELIERNVDLLITRELGPLADERLHYDVLFDDSYSVVVGGQNAWARRRTVDLADLVNDPWTLPSPGSTTYAVVMEAFRARKLNYPRTSVITESFEVRMNLLTQGPFISSFPNSRIEISCPRSGVESTAC